MPVFDYHHIDFEPCPVFPGGSRVCRPYVRARLQRGNFHSHEFDALVDTGADYCTFPASWVGVGDEEWDSLPSLEIDTIKGDRTIRFAVVSINIEKLGKIQIYAALSQGREEIGVLGHHGFLDRIRATFDAARGTFSLDI